MKITYERDTLLKNLLSPISKVAENCILVLNSKNTYCVVTSSDGGIVLYAQIDAINDEIKTEITLNVPNIKRFLQVFDCIEDPFIELNIESNHLAYESPEIKFKYFLLDNGVIETPPIKIDKIDALKFNFEFNISSEMLATILKGSIFTSDTNKIYFYSKDNKVFGELTDQATQNSDSLTFQIADVFTGSDLKQVLPINMDIIRLIGSIKTKNIKVSVNTENRVLLFEISGIDYKLKFIVSSLVK